MKKKVSNFLTIIMVLCLILGTNALAAARQVITLYAGSNVQQSATRTTNYSTVYSRLYSVYPLNGGTDNYQKIKVQVKTYAGNDSMSDIIALNETSSGNTSIKLKEGLLSVKNIKFEFSGNDPSKAAKADVYWDPR